MKVSILIATYNYAQYIGRAIESVMTQSYPAALIEVIVMDDGSTDDTAGVIERLQQQYSNLHYHVQPNAGKAVATQKSIALASGEILFTLDADDWFLPGKVADTVSIFQQHPQVVHVASAARIEWADGRPAEIEPVPEWLLKKSNSGSVVLKHFFEHNLLFGGGSTFAVRSAMAQNILWQPAIDMYTDEWLIIQALLAGDTYFLPAPRSVWFVHNANYSGAGGETLQKKQQRMRTSSACILQLLQTDAYPLWLKQTYELKDAIRNMVWQEASGKKTIADAWRFFTTFILQKQYSFAVLKKYHAFNRLLKW